MITEPKNLTEQILNLVERIATEMKALYATLETKLSATEAADTYAAKSTTYTKDEVDAKIGEGEAGLTTLALLDQLTGLRNGYEGTDYSFRDCLGMSKEAMVGEVYALYNGYNGTAITPDVSMTKEQVLSTLYEFGEGYEGAI